MFIASLQPHNSALCSRWSLGSTMATSLSTTCTAGVLCPLSFILFPLPIALWSWSSVLCPLRFFLCPLSVFLFPLPLALCSLSFVLCLWSVVFCPLPFAPCPLFFVLCTLSLVRCLLSFALSPFPFVLCPVSCVLCPPGARTPATSQTASLANTRMWWEERNHLNQIFLSSFF